MVRPCSRKREKERRRKKREGGRKERKGGKVHITGTIYFRAEDDSDDVLLAPEMA